MYLAPEINEKLKKCDSKRHQKMMDFWNDFLSILDPF